MTRDEFVKLALEAYRKSGPCCSSCFLDGAEWGRAQGVEAERDRYREALEKIAQYPIAESPHSDFLRAQAIKALKETE